MLELVGLNLLGYANQEPRHGLNEPTVRDVHEIVGSHDTAAAGWNRTMR